MIISIAIFIFTLLILVFIHELGHFLVAKRFGIKVEEFGFGFPPRIWGKKIGETLVSLNWLPFGGFVRLLGEDEVDKNILDNPRSFAAAHVWKRITVVIAGVLMNLFLAWIIFYVVIIGQNFRVIYPTKDLGVYVAQVENGYPAETAGIQVGEKLISINDEKIKDIDHARSLIIDKEGVSLKLTLSDIEEKEIRTLHVTPKKIEGPDALIGVVFSPLAFRHYETTSQKVFSAITYSWDLTKFTFIGLSELLSDLFTGNFEKASQSVSGPVGLATVTNDILSLGLQAIMPYLWFVGIISLTFAIFNLLPIPALDGGRFFFLLIEAITRRRVNAGFERWVHTIGMAVLLTLMLLVTFSDLRKKFP